MDVSTFLAQFWGWLLIIMSLIFLLRKKTWLDQITSFLKDKNYVMVTGWLALVLGLFTVILHNIWTADWRVVITIFGWFSLIKGILRLGFPELPRKTVSTLKNKMIIMQILLIISLLLGIYLLWMSY